MKINNTPYRQKCKSCQRDYLPTLKTIDLPNGEKHTFEEVFCNSCLSKYVTHLDFLNVNNYAHQNVSQGLTVPREYKDFVD